MITHESVLEAFALFDWSCNRGTSNNKSLAFDTGKRLESLDLRQEFLLHFVGNIGAELEENYRYVSQFSERLLECRHTNMDKSHFEEET